MASIQIQASNVITACKKKIKVAEKEATELKAKYAKRGFNKPDGPMWIDNLTPREIEEAMMILKLAEYAVTSHEDNAPTVICHGELQSIPVDPPPTIIIDQNDFELIGEFL